MHNPRHFIQSLCRHSFAHACSILVTTTAKWEAITLHTLFFVSSQRLLATLPQWRLHWTDSLGRVLLSLHRQSRSYSTVPSIQADHQIFSRRAKHHLQRSSGISIWRTLTSAAVRFTSFPGLFRSRILFYHACLLLDNMSTFHARSCRGYREKRRTDRRKDTRTHTHTHTHTHTQTDRLQ